MKIRLVIGLVTLISPVQSRAQVGAGPLTPVTPPQVAVPEPKLPTIPRQPSDFQSGGRARAAATASGYPAPNAPQEGGQGFTGYSGGDLIINDGDPSLWRGPAQVRRQKIPKYHTVKQGETLWTICNRYYEDPWCWPQLWSLNPKVTNPHWIYPGDRVRLMGGEDTEDALQAADKTGEGLSVSRLNSTGPQEVALRLNAFADPTELEAAGLIAGSSEERLLISQRDEVYLKGGEKFKPQIGKSYTIYRVREKLTNHEGEHVGNLVEIQGTARVKRNQKGTMATAEITESLNAIERKDRIGPLRRRFRRLPAKPAEKNITAYVVGALKNTTYHGVHELVFIDKGADDGVRMGNRFLVIRRGDGYKRLLQQEDDENPDFPKEVVAEIGVVDVRDKVSIGWITKAVKEVRINDRIEMQKGY